MGNAGHAGKEVHRFVHLHLQHVTNAFAAPGDSQCFGIETSTVAGLARHLDVGQETHFDGAQALPFAHGATAFAGVEAEATWAIATGFGFEGIGKQFAHRVPKTNVSGGARTRRFADGGLVDFEHAVDGLGAQHTRAALPLGALASMPGGAAGLGGLLAHRGSDVGEQHVAGEGGFTRAADAGDGNQALQGDLGGEVLEVMERGVLHRQPLLVR